MDRDAIKAKIMDRMKNLPPLPTVTTKLLSIIRDERSSADDVNGVLSADQALAGKVLKLVNSSFYGQSGEVSTITRAVVILGFGGVRNLALGFGTVQALKDLGGGLTLDDFWEHALACAAGAQALSPVIGQTIDPEEAFIAGLMHDIGQIVLASAVPEEFSKIMEAEDANHNALEKEAFGMNHTQVGEKLLQYWQLPETLCQAVRNHHNFKAITGGEQPLTALVGLGDVLACLHGGTFERPIGEAELSKLNSAFGLKLADFCGALDCMDEKVDEMRELLRVSGAGTRGTANESFSPVTVTVVSSDPERSKWTKGLLEHFGNSIFPMKPYFAQESGHEEVKLVLLDPQCLTKPQITKLKPFLTSQPAQIAVLVGDEGGNLTSELMAEYPSIPFVFSRQDLQNLLTLQPA